MIRSDVPIPRKCMRLDKAAFNKGKVTPSINLDGIATLQQKATYYSPGAGDIGLTGGDLPVIREVAEFNRPLLPDHCFLGCISNAKYKLALRREGEQTTPFSWRIGLFHYQDSGAVALPVTMRDVPGHPDCVYADFDMTCVEPACHGIFFGANIKAIQCHWRSWAWQCKHLPNARTYWRTALRLIAETKDELPLMQVVARSAWYDFEATLLRKIAKFAPLDIPAECDLLDILMRMTKRVLNIGDAAAIDIIAKRLAVKEVEPETYDMLLNCDEAVDCMEKNDGKVLC